MYTAPRGLLMGLLMGLLNYSRRYTVLIAYLLLPSASDRLHSTRARCPRRKLSGRRHTRAQLALRTASFFPVQRPSIDDQAHRSPGHYDDGIDGGGRGLLLRARLLEAANGPIARVGPGLGKSNYDIIRS